MDSMIPSENSTAPGIFFDAYAQRFMISGQWKTGQALPDAEEFISQLKIDSDLKTISFDSNELRAWDSNLLTFLIQLEEFLKTRGLSMDSSGLPDGVIRLLKLARMVPEREGAKKEFRKNGFLEQVGESTTRSVFSIKELLDFLGEAALALVNLFRGKARVRGSDLLLIIQECGVQALPIVSLISLLVGLILAFVGAVQLKAFGAQIYVADLVGIGIVREMGAIMAGVIMAGRTGAAFAAQLGTMQVNEEIDALRTMGISPMEFLVLPRMIALFLMMPLLCVFADLMGILGGFLVGVTMLDLNFMRYYNQTVAAVGLNDLFIGIFMSAVFGVLIALSGCLRGMQCERSSAAVGQAATSAVVTSIVSIVVATAIITVACAFLGI